MLLFPGQLWRARSLCCVPIRRVLCWRWRDADRAERLLPRASGLGSRFCFCALLTWRLPWRRGLCAKSGEWFHALRHLCARALFSSGRSVRALRVERRGAWLAGGVLCDAYVRGRSDRAGHLEHLRCLVAAS
eukprot:Amastigsp_a508393_6.p4 type:complete len:132 gc:universal Amastigsp_a508393_6:1616-2011(+)